MIGYLYIKPVPPRQGIEPGIFRAGDEGVSARQGPTPPTRGRPTQSSFNLLLPEPLMPAVALGYAPSAAAAQRPRPGLAAVPVGLAAVLDPPAPRPRHPQPTWTP